MWLNILWMPNRLFLNSVAVLQNPCFKSTSMALTWVLAFLLFCSCRAASDPAEGTGKPNSRTMLVLTQRRKQTSDKTTTARKELRAVTKGRKIYLPVRGADMLAFKGNLSHLSGLLWDWGFADSSEIEQGENARLRAKQTVLHSQVQMKMGSDPTFQQYSKLEADQWGTTGFLTKEESGPNLEGWNNSLGTPTAVKSQSLFPGTAPRSAATVLQLDLNTAASLARNSWCRWDGGFTLRSTQPTRSKLLLACRVVGFFNGRSVKAQVCENLQRIKQEGMLESGMQLGWENP